MKSYLLLLTLSLLLTSLYAQAPSAIPYQAVARNSSGNLLQSQSIGLRFSIHDGTAGGTVVYQETQTATTNALGLFSVNIGQGTAVSGSFNAINWDGGSKFTQVEMDPAGGTAYVDMGTTQMLSVPYALYAGSSGSSPETDPQVSSATTSRVPRWNGSTLTDGSLFDDGTKLGLGTTSPSYLLHVLGTSNSALKLESSSTVGTWLNLQNTSTGGRSWNLISAGQGNGEGAGKLLFNDASASTRMVIDGSGNVGLGTTSPSNKLDVRGGFAVGTNYAGFTTAPANGAIIQGNVGIGTNAPLNNLDVEGGVAIGSTYSGTSFAPANGAIIQGNVGIGTSSPQQALSVYKGLNLDQEDVNSGTLTTNALTFGSGSGEGIASRRTNGSNKYGLDFYTNNSSKMSITYGGDMGIGTTTPFNKLDVEGGLAVGSTFSGASQAPTNGAIIEGNVGVGTNEPQQNLSVYGGLNIDQAEANASTTTNALTFGSGSGEGIASRRASGGINRLGLDFYTAQSIRMSISQAGNVGIGTNAPFNKLDVEGGVAVGSTFSGASSAPTNGAIIEGNVGIGTSAPQQNLSVYGGLNIDQAEANASTTTNALTFGSGSGEGIASRRASGGTNRFGLDFYTAQSIRMSISQAGNVGIGTSSPGQKLEVSGTTKTTNLQMTSGATSGYVLQSDASGNASWVNPTSLSITETDPQVSSSTTSRVPRWTGTALSDGSIFDNGTNVGIGTTSPGQKLEVSGTTKTTNLQMTSGATSGYLLQCDASGNGSWVNPTTLTAATPTLIQDADANTQVKAGSNSSDDVIRFTMSGTEYFTMDGPRLDVKNSGRSVFIGESAGINDDLSDNDNVFIGFQAGNDNTSGGQNVSVGRSCLKKHTTGDFNVAMGYLALHENLTGSTNTALGTGAGQFCTGSGNTFIGYAAGLAETGSNKLYIDNSSTSSPLIWGDFSSNYLNFNANVGIGTTSPTQAQLVINGSESYDVGSYGYLNDNGNTGTANNGAHAYSIYASNRVAASEFNAHSDARIKNIRGTSDSRQDLNTLMGIKITDYTLKDTIAKGSRPFKKVVAQQVEAVYPQAVNRLTDVVPDIYQLAEIKDGFIQLPNCPLKTGERVKLIFGKKQELVEVLHADATGFQVNLTGQGPVFVYGREVDDFRTVDYEALSTLNISATQELVKMIEQQRATISALQSDVQMIKAALQLNGAAASATAGQK